MEGTLLSVCGMSGVEDGVNDKGSRDWGGTFEVTFVSILMLNKEF